MTNTIPNVPRELLEEVMLAAQRMPVRGPSIRAKLHTLLSTPSPAGVDGCKCSMSISVLGDGCRYCQPQEYIDRLSEMLDEERAELSDAQAIIDGLRGEVDKLMTTFVRVADHLHIDCEKAKSAPGKPSDVFIAAIDQQAQRIGELAELAAQASVNCKNTAYYLRKYRPDLADICSGWCVAIDAALSAGKYTAS